MTATLTPLPVCPVWVQALRVLVSMTEPALLRYLGTILEILTTSERLASSRSCAASPLRAAPRIALAVVYMRFDRDSEAREVAAWSTDWRMARTCAAACTGFWTPERTPAG